MSQARLAQVTRAKDESKCLSLIKHIISAVPHSQRMVRSGEVYTYALL